jgi:hypothetical protein
MRSDITTNYETKHAYLPRLFEQRDQCEEPMKGLKAAIKVGVEMTKALGLACVCDLSPAKFQRENLTQKYQFCINDTLNCVHLLKFVGLSVCQPWSSRAEALSLQFSVKTESVSIGHQEFGSEFIQQKYLFTFFTSLMITFLTFYSTKRAPRSRTQNY